MKNQKEKMRQITLKLPESTHVKFKIICAALHKNMNDFLESKVNELIEDKKEIVAYLDKENENER
jgi:hypothetical protein